MRKFGLLGILLLAFLSYGAPSGSQTPDGQTPARESVCEPLKAGNVTKGLYGLCVAFCEAHDATDLSISFTKDKLEKLLASKPNGPILQKYRTRMRDGDPDMPCLNVVVTANACPCWTEGQLVAADGRHDYYNTVENTFFNYSKAPPRLTEVGFGSSFYIANFTYDDATQNGRQCTYSRIDFADSNRKGQAIFVTDPPSPDYPTMTDLQADFCSQQIQKHIDWVNSRSSGLSQ